MKNKSIIFVAIVLIVGLVILFLTLGNRTYYTVTFNSDGGTELESVRVKEKTVIKLKTDITKDGYTFGGWLENDEVVPSDYKVLKDVTLTANWIEKEVVMYTVTFDTKGGSKIDDIVVNSEKVLVLPNNPTKEGYKFIGWEDTTGKKVYDKSKIKENTTLVAIWREIGTEVEEKEYYCDNGYKLKDGTCSYTETINYTITSDYVCSAGKVRHSTNPKICVATEQTAIRSLCDKGAIRTYIKSNTRYCVYEEHYVSIKDKAGVDLPVAERPQFCTDEFGDKFVYAGVDSTKKLFICERSDNTSSKRPDQVCAKGETYKLLSDGMTFACYNQFYSDAQLDTVYCPTGYVKGDCSSTLCSCSRTITVPAKEK